MYIRISMASDSVPTFSAYTIAAAAAIPGLPKILSIISQNKSIVPMYISRLTASPVHSDIFSPPISEAIYTSP